MENINQLKLDFLDYLKEKYKDDSVLSEKMDLLSPELSIFMYSADFQDYLSEKGYSDNSIFSQSISDIKNILSSPENKQEYNPDNENIIGDDFMLNTLTDAFNQDEDLFSVINKNSNEKIDSDEVIAFLDSVEAEMNANPDEYETAFDGISKGIQNIKGEAEINNTLDTIYNSEKALHYLDLDNDGEINDIEKELFETYVQGDKEELTVEDLQKVLSEIENGTFNYDVKLPENAVDVKDIPETVTAESEESSENISARQTSNPAQSLSPTGRTSSGASAGSYPSQTQVTPSNINEMNLEQLKKEQDVRQGNVDSAKNDVDKALSDIDEVKTNEYPQAKEAYDTAIQNDENISEELKEKRTANLISIENTTNDIIDLNSKISKTEIDLANANDKLDGDKKNLSALKSALSSFDNAENQEEVASQKAEIQAQINTLEQTVIPQDEQNKKELEETLNGGGENKGLKEQLQEKETELKELQETRTEIESEIAATGNETSKKALEEFKAVEAKLDDLVEQLPAIQQKLVDAQSDLTEVNELIRTKEAESTKTEKSYYNGSLPSELVSALDGKLGAGFCAKLEQVAKNINCEPTDLLGMMQSESGINPQAYNKNGGATGLIQFMPGTARSLGTTTQALMNMSAVEQLDYVEKFYKNWTGGSGQRLSAGDLYTLCFLPAFVNREVLCSQGDKYYNANSGLDGNHDGKITKTEMGDRVKNKYNEVLRLYGLA